MGREGRWISTGAWREQVGGWWVCQIWKGGTATSGGLFTPLL